MSSLRQPSEPEASGAIVARGLASERALARRTVLLTGASGYVGGQLLRRLERGPARVRCLSRSPQALHGRVSARTEVVAGDVLDRSSLDRALYGVHTACYLVHSMGGHEDFERLDRRAAMTFGAACRAAGVSQIVYLGGLGDAADLSKHLASRHEVGELLRLCGVPTVELRASIVIGSGSASFETLRALVERLPVIVAPPWSHALAQPIAIDEVVMALLAALSLATPVDATDEIGGTDRITFPQLMQEYARQRGLRRAVVRTPLVTPAVARAVLPLLVPTHGRVAAAMVDSLRNETVVRRRGALAPPRRARTVSAAIAQALTDEDRELARRLSSEVPVVPLWRGSQGRRLVLSRVARVEQARDVAFRPIEQIGGENGWYSAGWFWRMRGLLDRMRGGVGLRRGRPGTSELRVGEEIDFWRVEQVEPGRLLRLAAEMKMPGRLWLQFEARESADGAALHQTTMFDPAGYVGRAYWYLLYPVHRWVFASMLRGISQAAERTPAGTSRLASPNSFSGFGCR